MNRIVETLMADLRHIIATAGDGQGRITPSVYDTAQVLRLYPPTAGVRPGLDWLLDQQRADGGWGNATVPIARDIPTLAALITLTTYKSEYHTPSNIEQAIEAGIEFLRQQRGIWTEPLPDDLPTGAEMVLIELLDTAADVEIDVHEESYGALRALGKQKRQYIAEVQPGAGTAPTYTWEAWGQTADTTVLDGSGGVGHSPAATAAWLDLSTGNERVANHREGARRYLAAAMQATGAEIPGVVPTVWPIKRFEQSWVLYSLFVTDLLASEHFADLTDRLVAELASVITPLGIGMSDHFTADGDITSTTTAVLRAAGRPVDISRLQRFRNNSHFITYREELQSSLTTTAHAVLALGLAGQNVDSPCQFLISHQDADGCWRGDKWHSSWLYTTATVVAALVHAGKPAALEATREAVLSAQNKDGGWGVASQSTTSETSYALHILLMLGRAGLLNDSARAARNRGHHWLLSHYRPFKSESTSERLWIGKDLYAPTRVDRANELSALLAIALSGKGA